MLQANCSPILIGSLPLSDHQRAMQLILKYCPEIPLWPQLPGLPKEGMVRQFMTGFPGLQDQDNTSFIDNTTDDFEEEMTVFYTDYFEVLENSTTITESRFVLGGDTAKGFLTLVESGEKLGNFLTLKGQVTGPVTTGIGIKDNTGTPIIYNDHLRDVLIKHLGLKGLYQVLELKKLTGDQPPIIFIDEPGIVSFGSTGFSGVTREMVSESVAEVIRIIQNGGGLAGIHICANGDWGPPLSSEADIISFDAYFYFDNFILYKDQLTTFLHRGGILAWGIIPTGDPEVVERENSESLYEKWRQQLTTLSKFGVTEQQLMKQTLIAPSCGTGSLSPELAEKVFAMTAEVSKMAKNYLQS